MAFKAEQVRTDSKALIAAVNTKESSIIPNVPFGQAAVEGLKFIGRSITVVLVQQASQISVWLNPDLKQKIQEQTEAKAALLKEIEETKERLKTLQLNKEKSITLKSERDQSTEIACKSLNVKTIQINVQISVLKKDIESTKRKTGQVIQDTLRLQREIQLTIISIPKARMTFQKFDYECFLKLNKRILIQFKNEIDRQVKLFESKLSHLFAAVTDITLTTSNTTYSIGRDASFEQEVVRVKNESIRIGRDIQSIEEIDKKPNYVLNLDYAKKAIRLLNNRVQCIAKCLSPLLALYRREVNHANARIGLHITAVSRGTVGHYIGLNQTLVEIFKVEIERLEKLEQKFAQYHRKDAISK